MFIAWDEDHNRIKAEKASSDKDYFCQYCGEKVILRNGNHNRVHFAHLPKSECVYGKNADNKSPWHIRMQELFPEDAIEVRFQDKNTGEVHIADVFLEKTNVVIEFQHSPIDDKELISRTIFHTSEGRRIAWVFDECKEGSEFGRLKRGDNNLRRDLPNGWLYGDLHRNLHWPRSPRKVLLSLTKKKEELEFKQVSICINWEGNQVHRIVNQADGYKEITISLAMILIGDTMTGEEFFVPEDLIQKQSPYAEWINEYDYLTNKLHPKESIPISKIWSATPGRGRRPL